MLCCDLDLDLVTQATVQCYTGEGDFGSLG